MAQQMEMEGACRPILQKQADARKAEGDASKAEAEAEKVQIEISKLRIEQTLQGAEWRRWHPVKLNHRGTSSMTDGETQ